MLGTPVLETTVPRAAASADLAAVPGSHRQLVPERALGAACSGFTVGAPPTTWSLMPSFGYVVTDGAEQPLVVRLVLAEQRRRRRAVRPGAREQLEGPEERVLDVDRAVRLPPPCTGLGAPSSQDQVLRNQAVGSTCSVSASGPRWSP